MYWTYFLFRDACWRLIYLQDDNHRFVTHVPFDILCFCKRAKLLKTYIVAILLL